MKILRITGVIAIAAILSGLAFTTFSYRYAYKTLQSSYTKLMAQYETERNRLSQRSTLWHAEVVSVDVPRNQLTIILRNQILAGQENATLTLEVSEATLFVRQSLTSSNGVYVGFSETASGSLSDLSPGMLIAVDLSRKWRAERATADVILFGGAM
ncbi:MAG: hypothetical protein Athens041674_919 [Parcubacteria group bacterium Athens0416_74]|nr:MAG: hypothetical protein Athens041674_919 [Parcubacteria group bacterium Athens0416_74]